MSKVTVYVGLDYHKDSIQVCAMDAAGKVLVNRSCRNDALAVARLVATQADHVRGAIEACCGAADLADELVGRHSWRIRATSTG